MGLENEVGTPRQLRCVPNIFRGYTDFHVHPLGILGHLSACGPEKMRHQFPRRVVSAATAAGVVTLRPDLNVFPL